MTPPDKPYTKKNIKIKYVILTKAEKIDHIFTPVSLSIIIYPKKLIIIFVKIKIITNKSICSEIVLLKD